MPIEPDDLSLLRAYANDRDDRAFARLVERHGRWIVAAARRRLGDDHLADDAAQAAFVLLAEKAGPLVASLGGGGGSLAAWLFHVAHFTCARIHRAQARRATHERAAAEHRRELDDAARRAAERARSLEEHVARLAPADRELIVRRFYRRQPFAEIGAATGVNAEAARKRVGRALATLRAMLNDAGDVAGALRRDLRPPRVAGVRMPQPQEIEMDPMPAPADPRSSAGGFQMVSAEFVVGDVEANLAFFESLGFPRRFVDQPDADGRIPRASVTAGRLGKVWIRRPFADETVRASPGVKPFFWIEGGPDGLVAYRQRLIDAGVPTTPIVDEHRLPNFDVATPDGHAIAFFTAYVAPGAPPIVFQE